MWQSIAADASVRLMTDRIDAAAPAAQAQPGGYALGSQVPQATLADIVAGAGFSHFRRVTETPFSRVFEARP